MKCALCEVKVFKCVVGYCILMVCERIFVFVECSEFVLYVPQCTCELFCMDAHKIILSTFFLSSRLSFLSLRVFLNHFIFPFLFPPFLPILPLYFPCPPNSLSGVNKMHWTWKKEGIRPRQCYSPTFVFVISLPLTVLSRPSLG